MPKKEISAAGATKPQGPYSHAIRAGDLLFVSGQGPLDEEGRIVGENVAEQTRVTMQNLTKILEAAGGTFANAVQVTVFLSTMSDYQAFNTAYREFVEQPFPARICVAAGGLLKDMLIEVDLIAYLGD